MFNEQNQLYKRVITNIKSQIQHKAKIRKEYIEPIEYYHEPTRTTIFVSVNYHLGINISASRHGKRIVLFNPYNLKMRTYMSPDYFARNNDVRWASYKLPLGSNDVECILQSIFEMLEHQYAEQKQNEKEREAKKKQYEIDVTWRQHDTINAYHDTETRSYLKDFDEAELEWEARLAVLRYERRNKQLLDWLCNTTPKQVVSYIMFLQDKAAGETDDEFPF